MTQHELHGIGGPKTLPLQNMMHYLSRKLARIREDRHPQPCTTVLHVLRLPAFVFNLMGFTDFIYFQILHRFCSFREGKAEVKIV